jgi:heme-degrading monooxygenase HmoA
MQVSPDAASRSEVESFPRVSRDRSLCEGKRPVHNGGALRLPRLAYRSRVTSFPPPLPWKALGGPPSEREYLVLLTFLPLQRLSKLPRFLAYVRRIQRQLDDGPDGLIGYSLLAKPLSSKYWTLSVWDDDAALGRFIQQSPHRDAMHELPNVLSGFRTTRWTSRVGPCRRHGATP